MGVLEKSIEAAKGFEEPFNKLTVPLATSAGETLSDIWELVFGGLGLYVDKKRAERENALEDFKLSLTQKIAKIPASDLIEPKLSVVGPALESSKYYFEEKMIRDMFANLIAKSMDKKSFSKIHPIFLCIIQQMSPLDAQNLSLFGNGYLPIVNYRFIKTGNRGSVPVCKNVFLHNQNELDIHKQTASIETLQRLGIIQIDYDIQVADCSQYDIFHKHSYYQSLMETLPSHPQFSSISIQYGVVFLTYVGINFHQVCLDAL